MKQMNFEDVEFGRAEDDGEFFGYRIDRMCIRNFGGYHGEPQTLVFGNDGTILTGANGAGKTTAIDALTLLFNTNPSFNAAANAPNSRSTESYYKGTYQEDQTSGTDKSLRSLGDKNMFMGISATFKKSDGQKYSIVRLTYISDAGNVTTFYVTADDEISLKDDFPIWLSYGVLRGECEKYGWNLFNTFEQYLTQVSETFGFESVSQCKDAFKFLSKSIKQEPITCVTKFARKNILPEKDFSAVMESAAAAVDKCHQQLMAIEESRDKIAALRKVEKKIGEVLDLEREVEDSVTIQNRVQQFNAKLQIAKSTGLSDFTSGKLVELDAELAKIEADLSAYSDEYKKIQAAIADAGIDRVKDMRKEEADLARQINYRTDNLQDLMAEFDDFGVHLDASTAATWQQSFEKVGEAALKIQNGLSEDKAQREEINTKKVKQEGVVSQVREQLKSLEESRTSLEPSLVRARDAIAGQIGLNKASLPFFAELVQIRDGEEEWEGVANRVLNALGQTIMVPEESYRDAKRVMNQGRWGTFVRLARVSHDTSTGTITPGTLADKLMISTEYPYQEAVREKLSKSAFHACLSQDEFIRSTGAAVTKEGSIQRSAGQAEKNDRRKVDDSSTYILGWSVEDRIDQLRQTLSIEAQKYETLKEHLAQWDGTISSKEGKLTHYKYGVQTKASAFEDHQVATFSAAIEALRAELAVLESKKSFDLIKRSEELDDRITDLNTRKQKVRVDIDVKQNAFDSSNEEIWEQEKALVKEAQAYGALTEKQLATLNKVTAELLGIGDEDPIDHISKDITLNLLNLIPRIQIEVGGDVTKVKTDLARKREKVLTLADKFTREYSDEGQYLGAQGLLDDTDEGEARRKEWYARLAQLETDDLAGAEKTQHEELIASVQSAPAQLASAIEDFDRSVKRRIDIINDILKGHVFDPVDGTYARISLKRSQNSTIAYFDKTLKDAVSVSLNFDESSDTDAVMNVVNSLLGGNETQDSARKAILSDLRNRWDVSVIEYQIDEDGAKRTKRDIGAKVGTLSGGQIERMTNLLTGAAMSSAFGSHDQFRRDKSLMMVILDEAFSKSSKETSKASSDIYKAMGIQMIVAAPSDKLNFDTAFAQRIIEVVTTDGQATSISQPMSNLDMDAEVDI